MLHFVADPRLWSYLPRFLVIAADTVRPMTRTKSKTPVNEGASQEINTGNNTDREVQPLACEAEVPRAAKHIGTCIWKLV